MRIGAISDYSLRSAAGNSTPKRTNTQQYADAIEAEKYKAEIKTKHEGTHEIPEEGQRRLSGKIIDVMIGEELR